MGGYRERFHLPTGCDLRGPRLTMNPHVEPSTSPAGLLRVLYRNRDLTIRLVRRDIAGRYRGSVLGLTWSFFHPLLMLAVYTFVFSTVFNARWAPDGGETTTQFAVVLFVGMMVHGLMAEVLNRAPTQILANVNYVKKVVFPLEILPVVSMGAALFHALISLAVLLAVFMALNGYIHWTSVLIPLVLLPLVVLTLGLAWGLASLGVFLRDVGQTIGIVTTVLLFLAPVFYPVTALPPELRPLIMANPLTFIIEQARDVLIWGRVPDWGGLAMYTLAAVFVAWGGYAWFQKTRKGFADVL